MKYTRLSKEQFEALNEEFVRFLATQSITADEWEKIKKETPQVAEDKLDVFSDLIWESTLSKVNYLENWSEQQVYLFKFNKNNIHLIAVKISEPGVNLLTNEGIQWLEKNISKDEVEIFKAEKNYDLDGHLEKFNFIKEGSIISEGGFYSSLIEIL